MRCELAVKPDAAASIIGVYFIAFGFEMSYKKQSTNTELRCMDGRQDLWDATKRRGHPQAPGESQLVSHYSLKNPSVLPRCGLEPAVSI